MNSPLISIITPSYNQGAFIEENITSIKNSEYPNVEHIIVDGGSTDDTVSILERYEDDYNLRWVSEPDRGQSHAVNKAIRMSNGEWIGWQNSDDYYLPSAFNTFREQLTVHPHAEMIYGDLLIADKEGSIIDRSYCSPPSKFIHRYGSLFATNQSAFFKKDLLDTVAMVNRSGEPMYVDENRDYTMDNEFFWRILGEKGEFIRVNEFIGVWRKHDDIKTIGHGRYSFASKEQRKRGSGTSEDRLEEIYNLYGTPTYEKIVPYNVLRALAISVKGMYLLKDGRIDAFRQGFDKAL